MNDQFIEPEDQMDNLEWRIAEDGGNILINTLTGKTVKYVKPLYLPDGTLMQTNVLFCVEATRMYTLSSTATIKPGEFLIAKRQIDGEIVLWTNAKYPSLVQIEAKHKRDFAFVTDLKKLSDGNLKMKLRRVLEIENYEYAACIRDELKGRKIEVDLDELFS